MPAWCCFALSPGLRSGDTRGVLAGRAGGSSWSVGGRLCFTLPRGCGSLGRAAERAAPGGAARGVRPQSTWWMLVEDGSWPGHGPSPLPGLAAKPCPPVAGVSAMPMARAAPRWPRGPQSGSGERPASILSTTSSDQPARRRARSSIQQHLRSTSWRPRLPGSPADAPVVPSHSSSAGSVGGRSAPPRGGLCFGRCHGGRGGKCHKRLVLLPSPGLYLLPGAGQAGVGQREVFL